MIPPIAEMSKFKEIAKPGFANAAFERVKPYVSEFLTDKHPYRSGAVCPFVAGALKNDDIYFSYGNHVTDTDWDAHIATCVLFMSSLRNRDNKFGRALIILLPEDFDVATLLRIHVRNKIRCVKSFLMLGALYKESNALSLHSHDFYPLRTPVPTLVIREITAGDLIFLEPSHYNVLSRLRFLHAFISRFDVPSASKFERAQVEVARYKARQYRCEIRRTMSTYLGAVLVLTGIVFLLCRV
ncbi:hypothetical protein DYL61_04665 [Pseudomonas nabeulensis]|uniref:DUF6875 domain-containing protein n=1 Tax=Pseudomonas nabeulensis TaxID=2293833 RepID=A0A4Z0BA91_9PSED|nr:hypothetical protein [Pseudomonas nabeulensis]TFY95244.1 hypothetical protein DYL61_04665 [Pseudomonas nabeulensis]